MKVKKFIVAMVVAISVSSGLMVGCASSKPDLDKKIYTAQEVSEIKKNFSKKISKSIKDSGLRLVEVLPDGSFVLSLGNLEKSKEQPDQVLNYSMVPDDKNTKEILNIQCVREYTNDEKLNESDKFLKAIYNIFKSLTDTELAEKEFFNEIEKTFNKGEGNVELPNMNGIHILVNKIDKSTKILELRFNEEFKLK
ncbi:hypothetical protein NSA24_10725 [Clostridioides mangenotii]|uniref:hypothetical protein n=1 Tax=Metaclostridioides mangenotii TaxID=1540 RepID=UPI00214A8034|nr:hypothetical protein [Clostridioides mangenotii]MCR1955264.1 hypothetical protein [Clostridioides mangenotii]